VQPHLLPDQGEREPSVSSSTAATNMMQLNRILLFEWRH
jgi:hypothetical protein